MPNKISPYHAKRAAYEAAVVAGERARAEGKSQAEIREAELGAHDAAVQQIGAEFAELRKRARERKAESQRRAAKLEAAIQSLKKTQQERQRALSAVRKQNLILQKKLAAATIPEIIEAEGKRARHAYEELVSASKRGSEPKPSALATRIAENRLARAEARARFTADYQGPADTRAVEQQIKHMVGVSRGKTLSAFREDLLHSASRCSTEPGRLEIKAQTYRDFDSAVRRAEEEPAADALRPGWIARLFRRRSDEATAQDVARELGNIWMERVASSRVTFQQTIAERERELLELRKSDSEGKPGPRGPLSDQADSSSPFAP